MATRRTDDRGTAGAWRWQGGEGGGGIAGFTSPLAGEDTTFLRIAERLKSIYMPATMPSLAQKYVNPPVVEAVWEVRFNAPIPDIKRKKLKAKLAKLYDTVMEEEHADVKVDFAARSARFADISTLLRFTSTDQVNMCVLRSSSMAWVRRAPYEGWEAFRVRIEDELTISMKVLGRVGFSRLGLRYVNRIDVLPRDDLIHYEEYLNYRIEHGKLLDPTVGYHWKLLKEFNDIGLKATVQSASIEPEIPGFGAISFDVDVFCDEGLPATLDGLLEKMEDMRTLKNEIFEGGITDKARETYSS